MENTCYFSRIDISYIFTIGEFFRKFHRNMEQNKEHSKLRENFLHSIDKCIST